MPEKITDAWRIEGDATQLIEQLTRLSNQITKQLEVTQQLANSVTKLANRQTTLEKVTRSLSNELKKSVTHVNKLEKGQDGLRKSTERTNTKLSEQKAKLRELAVEQSRADRSARAKALYAETQVTGGRLSKAYFEQVKATPEEITAAQLAQVKYRGALEATGVSFSQLQTIMLQQSTLSGRLNEQELKAIEITRAYSRELSGTLGAAERQRLSNLEKQEQATLKAAEAAHKLTITWQSFARLTIIQLTHIALSNIVAALRRGVKESQELQVRISEIRTISQEAQLNTTEWAAGLREVSEAFGLDIIDSARAAYQALSNQVVKGAQTFDFLRESAQLARTTVATQEQAVNALSSIIKSYGLSADDAGVISAKLFKGVELGRFRLEEIADTMGNVTVIAAELGVSLDELFATQAALTVQGFKAAHAMTQLRGFMTQLIKPGKDLEVLLNDLGVENGKTAIEIYGLGGLLDKLMERVEGNNTEIAQYIRNLRGLQLAISLTGEGHVAYADALDKIRNSYASYREATVIAMESDAVRLQKAIERVRNFFIIDFGNEIIKQLAEVGERFGGFDRLVKNITRSIVDLARISVVLLIPAINKIRLRMIALQAEISATQGASVAARTALNNMFTLVGTGAAFLAYEAIINYLNAIEARERRFTEQWTDDLKKREEAAKASADALIAPLNDGIQALFRAGAQVLTARIGEVNKSWDKFVKDSIQNTEIFKDHVEKLVDVLKEQQKVASQAAENAVKSIEDIDKANKDFKKTVEDLNLELRLEKAENVDEKLNIVKEELSKLAIAFRKATSAEDIIETSNKAIEKFKELNRLYAEADKNRKEKLDERVKTEEQILEINKKLDTLEGRRKGLERKSEPQKRVFKTSAAYETAAFNRAKAGESLEDVTREITTLLSERTKLIEKLRNDQIPAEQKVLDIVREINVLEKARVDRLERIRNEELIQKEIDEARNDIIEDRLQKIQGIIKSLSKLELENISKLDESKTFEENQRLFEKNIEERTKLVKELQTELQNIPITTGRDYAERAKAFQIEIHNAELAHQKLLDKLLAQRDLENFRGTRERLTEELKATEKYKADIEGSLKVTFANITRAFKEYIETSQSRSLTLKELVTGKKPVQGESELLKDAREVFKRFQESPLNLIEDLKKFPDVAKLLKEAVGPQLSFSLEDFQYNVEQSTNKIAELRTRIEESLKKMLGEPEIQSKVVETFTGNIVSATSALVDFVKALRVIAPAGTLPQPEASGGPIQVGRDYVPALLSPGEFVVNANSTRKFYSQLQAMNSFGRYAEGGMVKNVTTGDINIALSSSGSDRTDVVRIGQLLRREIRRGTVSLT